MDDQAGLLFDLFLPHTPERMVRQSTGPVGRGRAVRVLRSPPGSGGPVVTLLLPLDGRFFASIERTERFRQPQCTELDVELFVTT